MRRIVHKLKDNNGITLLMSMVLVLVVMLVSSAVLSAAITAAKQIPIERESQQAYLTVSSAAQLVRDGIAKESYTVSVKKTKKNNVEQASETTYTKASGSFAAVLNEAMNKALNGEKYHTVFTVSATGLSSVKVDFTMEGSKNVKVKFSIDGEDGHEMELAYTCTENKKTVTTSSGTGTNKVTVETVKTVYTWTARDITKVSE